MASRKTASDNAAAKRLNARATPHAKSKSAGKPALPVHPTHAVALDSEVKERTLARLRRIEGQVRGLQRMVEEERYCADILTQVTSVHEALRGVGRELMRNHLRHCASHAIRSGSDEADAMYEELLTLMYQHAR